MALLQKMWRTMLVVLLCVMYAVFPALFWRRTERVLAARMANKVILFVCAEDNNKDPWLWRMPFRHRILCSMCAIFSTNNITVAKFRMFQNSSTTTKIVDNVFSEIRGFCLISLKVNMIAYTVNCI